MGYYLSCETRLVLYRLDSFLQMSLVPARQRSFSARPPCHKCSFFFHTLTSPPFSDRSCSSTQPSLGATAPSLLSLDTETMIQDKACFYISLGCSIVRTGNQLRQGPRTLVWSTALRADITIIAGVCECRGQLPT